MDYLEALKYLDSFTNYEQQDGYNYNKSFRLDRMVRLASLLGDPQKGIKSIHVAGSKGKGSTAAFIHSILKSAGFKTGLYTSPHLTSFCERIRVDDLDISEEDVGRLLDTVKAAVDKMEAKPSFFEVCTALAYLYFKEKKVGFAVYETGLGGRLDATNIIDPLVCVITPISYEHTDKLGKTLALIAGEKAGIIKNNTVCISAPQEKEALEAIEKACAERNVELLLVGRDISFRELASDDRKEVFDVSGRFGEYGGLETNLLGMHQVVNGAAAIGAIEALRRYDITISPGDIRRGIKDAEWPGRLEVAGRRPLVVLDGAQNRASANTLAAAVKKIFKYSKLILVLGVSKDKDIKGILEELIPISDSMIFTKSRVADRALEPSEIEKLVPDKCVKVVQAARDAVMSAVAETGEDDLVLITGSLFLVGEAREILLRGTDKIEVR